MDKKRRDKQGIGSCKWKSIFNFQLCLRAICNSIFNCIALLCILPSCTSDELASDGPALEKEQVTLDMPITRGANDGDTENRISSARMVVFSTEGTGKVLVNTLLSNIGLDEGTIAFRELVPVGYLDLYLITNEPAGWNLTANFPVGSSAKTKDDLKKQALSLSAYPVVDSNNPIPMFGAYEGIYVDSDEKIYANNKSTLITPGEVSRLYAKVTLDISCVFSAMPAGSEPIELRSVAVINLPENPYLAPLRYSRSFFSGASVLPQEGVNYDSNTSGFATKSGAFTFYIPEHIINDVANRSYLSIMLGLKGGGTGSPSKEYRLYIGDGIAEGQPGHDNNTYMAGNTATATDLTVSRNTHYTFTATVKNFSILEIEFSSKVVKWGDTEDIDLTTGNKQAEANSYIMEPNGDPILIPVSRANASALGAQLALTDKYEAEIVWMEKWNGTAAEKALMGKDAPIRTLRAVKASTTDISKNYILVTPGAAEGNALVAIRKTSASTPNTNPILWSWHIWVTGEKETIEAGAGTKNAWMPYALGTLGFPDGLQAVYYQWGRKEPFAASQALTTASTNTLQAATRTPLAVITAWTGTAVTNAWGNGTKTVYDPCPPGWRMPSPAELQAAIPGGDVTTFPWTTAGREKATAGGFYPALGEMTTTPSFTGIGTTGKYWHATAAGGLLLFNNTAVSYTTEDASKGCAARCIRH